MKQLVPKSQIDIYVCIYVAVCISVSTCEYPCWALTHLHVVNWIFLYWLTLKNNQQKENVLFAEVFIEIPSTDFVILSILTLCKSTPGCRHLAWQLQCQLRCLHPKLKNLVFKDLVTSLFLWMCTHRGAAGGGWTSQASPSAWGTSFQFPVAGVGWRSPDCSR